MFRKLVSLFAFLTFVSAAPLPGQTPDAATIHGQVTDQSHAAVPGVQVTATNTLTGLARTTQTDSSDAFFLGGLPTTGSYDVVARSTGIRREAW